MLEPWPFKNPEREICNTETPILERYINHIFKRQANSYNESLPELKDTLIYVGDDLACFHTGLYTKRYKEIYMCFERNRKLDTTKQWCFKAFVDESSDRLKHISPLPSRPRFTDKGITVCFEPEWDVRINTEYILGDVRNQQRIPLDIRAAWNLPILLKTAVQIVRYRAKMDWTIAVPQMFQNQLQFLITIYLTNGASPDMAMTLSIVNGYYIGHTCLTLEMA